MHGALFSVLLSVVFLPVSVCASELGFKGNLLDRPCQIDPSSAVQDVTFMDTGKKLFYSPARLSFGYGYASLSCLARQKL